jgi:hypothetical protein
LKDRLANGSGRFRATVAEHFKTILGRDQIDFGTLIPYLEATMSGQSDRVVNHHFYGIAARQAAAHPETVGHLIERAVLGELKSLDADGREVWHPKEFSQTLRTLEQAGPEHADRVARIRKSIQPYREQNRIYGINDVDF